MATVAKVEERLAPAEASQLAVTWKRFRKHRLGTLGLIVLTLLILSVIFVPMISPFEYDATGEVWQYAPAMSVAQFGPYAGKTYILGTDDVGRDIFTRLFFAGRISLTVGILTTFLVVMIGATVGALAGFYGGAVDTVLMRFVDLMLSLPELPMLLILSKMLGSSGIMDSIFGRTMGTVATIILVLTLFGWLGLSRLVRGSMLSLRSLDFIEATKALGASNRRIILRHLMPNSFAPIIVAATLAVGSFIITESALSFLGLGIQPPTPSWGNLLTNSRDHMFFIVNINPFKEIRGYLVLFPGLMILLTVLSINFIGDALRDALDPRMKT
jgi:peptide/nickel transport system permease protein